MKRGMADFEVLPGQGLGPVRFGMSVREVEELLGRSDKATFFDDDGDRTIDLAYTGGNLFFHQENDFRLTNIEIDRECRCRFLGQYLFPRTRLQLMELLRQCLPEGDLARFRVTTNEDIEEVTLKFPTLRLNFYFDLNGNLQEVNWGVFINKRDEIEWPTSAALAK